MIEYPKFREIFLKNIYSLENLEDGEIVYHYGEFNETFQRSEKIAFSILKEEGIYSDKNHTREPHITNTPTKIVILKVT